MKGEGGEARHLGVGWMNCVGPVSGDGKLDIGKENGQCPLYPDHTGIQVILQHRFCSGNNESGSDR